MRAIRAVWLLAGIAVSLAGCQTDRDGVEVDVTAALRAYRARLDRRPGRAQVDRMLAGLKAEQLNDLGVLYEREGRLDRAAWAYQHAVWRNPRFGLAYVNLGNVLRKQGKVEEALFRYRQAMSADPSSFEAVNNFADLCAHERLHIMEAIDLLEPALASAGPRRAYGLDTLGWLYHLSGKSQRAAEILEAGLEEVGPRLSSLSVSLRVHLAQAYAALGRTGDAVKQEAEARRLKELLAASGADEAEDPDAPVREAR